MDSGCSIPYWLNECNPKIYGSFYSLSTQTVVAVSTPLAIVAEFTSISKGVIYDGTKLKVAVNGIYKIGYSVQLDKSGGSVSTCIFWIRLNGNNVANTGSEITINGQQSETFPFVEFILELKSTDYLEFCILSPDITMAATYFGAGSNYPAIPSIIVNVEKIA
jgi:hypothetical protein